MNPKRDPYNPSLFNPYATYQCSNSTFQQYLKCLSDQAKWNQILDISKTLIDELTIQLDIIQSREMCGLEIQCSISPLISVPGFTGLTC